MWLPVLAAFITWAPIGIFCSSIKCLHYSADSKGQFRGGRSSAQRSPWCIQCVWRTLADIWHATLTMNDCPTVSRWFRTPDDFHFLSNKTSRIAHGMEREPSPIWLAWFLERLLSGHTISNCLTRDSETPDLYINDEQLTALMPDKLRRGAPISPNIGGIASDDWMSKLWLMVYEICFLHDKATPWWLAWRDAFIDWVHTAWNGQRDVLIL